MRYGQVGGTGKVISRVVLGCDRLARTGHRILDVAFSNGINAFDTARMYRRSEATLGEWISANGLRERVFIVSKGGHPTEPGKNRLERGALLSDLERSLTALRCDYVDLYLAHYDAPEIPAATVFALLDEIRESGRARCVGVANFNMDRVQEIQAAARRVLSEPLTAVSVQLSLPTLNCPMWMWPATVSIGGADGRAACAWYAETQLPLFAYSSLGRGFFAAEFWEESGGGAPGSNVEWLKRVLYSDENVRRFRRAEELAVQNGATTAQIGIAYVLCSGLNVFAVVSCNNSEHCRQNASAAHIDLSPVEVESLRGHP
jgi:aryl-alcohol dehydrogenase-like predicted oxidoreductase